MKMDTSLFVKQNDLFVLIVRQVLGTQNLVAPIVNIQMTSE